MPRKKSKSYTSSNPGEAGGIILSDKARAAEARGVASVFGDFPEGSNKFGCLLHDMERSLFKFEEALALPPSETNRNSAILLFLLSAELVWKTLKAYLGEKLGVKDFEINSPKGVVREAFKQGLIGDEPFWLDIADLRNQVVHTYREDLAEEIYAALPKIFSLYRNLLETLKRKANE